MNKIKILKTTIAALLTTLVFTPLSSAWAQEEANTTIEEVIITGSRIPQNQNLDSASPVTQVTADEFLYTGVTRVEDLLNDLPQVTGSNSSSDANGATGTATADLRDLGPERTLTLMNGRRLPVGSPVQGAAGSDLNFIPSILVERVDVLTGGASATYGSDAIGGVINFIMKDDLEGFLVDVQASTYTHSNDNSGAQARTRAAGFDLPKSSVTDGEAYTLSLGWGTNFAEGKGNFTAYANYRDVEAVTQSERDFSACALNGVSTDDSFTCAGSGTVAEGRVISLDSVGNLDLVVREGRFDPYSGETFNFAPSNYYQRPDERTAAGFFTHYDFSDTLTGYAEFGYMKNETTAQIAPSGSFFNAVNISCGSPLLSAQQFQALCGSIGKTANDTTNILAIKRNVEGGFRAEDIEHEQTRYVLGLKGAINDNWSFDVSALYGNVDRKANYRNDLSITRIQNALDVVDDGSGSPVCRSVVNGSDPNCVPWDIYNVGGVTQSALDYLDINLYQEGSTSVTNVIGYVNGDLTDRGWVMPGASSGVQVVAGLEYREEELAFRPNANYISGDGAGQGGPTPPVDGKFSVDELFLEAQVPLTDSMNLGLGYRYSDYDTDQSTDAYKATYDWQFVDGIKVRASYQAASRHANVRELFRPQGIGLVNLNDPCDGVPTASAAACANSGVTAAQYGNILQNPAGQYNELQGGNPLLQPEESDTYSIGFVLTPESIPGLDITIDWYSIDVQGAISTAGSAYQLTQCVTANQFCDNINRGPLGTLWIGSNGFISDTNANIGFEEREGFDVYLNYQFDMGDLGEMRVNYNANFLTTYDTQPVPGATVVDCKGFFSGNCDVPNPDYRHNVRLTWGMPWADIATTLAWRHHASVDEEPTAGSAVLESFDSQDYFDLAALWQVNDSLSLRMGINNLFDKEPPLSGDAQSSFNNGNVEVTEYDVLGRYWFLGATYSFGG